MSPNCKTRFSQKPSNLELWCLWFRTRAFQRIHYWTTKIQDGWDPPSWKSTCRHFFLMTVDKISQTGAEWHVDCGDMVKIETRCRIPIRRTFGRIPWHASHSHVSHCRVLPLGEFTVTIPEPHATLQGAVTWRNQCHDRATLQGVIIPSAILKIVFSPYFILFFWFFNAVWALTSGSCRIVSDTLVYSCSTNRYISWSELTSNC